MMRDNLLYTRNDGMRQKRKFTEGEIQAFFPVRERFEPLQPPVGPSSWLNTVDQLNRNAKFDDHQNFYQTIGPILAAVQPLGIFLVPRNSSQTSRTLPRGIIKFQILYNLIVIILFAIRTMIAIFRAIETSMNTSSFDTEGGILNIIREITFYLNATVSMIVFLWLSPKWMKLQKEWEVMEKQLNRANADRPRLRFKFYTISCLVMIPALVEHALSIYNNISTPRLVSDTSTGFFDDCMRTYLLKAFPPTFYIFLAGMVMFILQEFSIIIWNFTDIFIMLVSTGLAERYRSLNETASILVKKHRYSINWLQLREKYATLSILVKKTDECISPLVLLSFAINIYVICLQLYNGLANAKTGRTGTIYFFGSFCLLLGRTIAVTLLAARVNDQSQIFLPELYSCPTPCFTIETERLQNQLTSDNVALTGMKFFFITRQFLMAVASVIITYEVVLLQANKVH